MKMVVSSTQKAQTVLEYVMLLAVLIIPVGLAVRSAMQDSEEGARDNAIRALVSDSYGNEEDLGVIGRPYP